MTLSGTQKPKKVKLSERSTRYFQKFMFEPSHPRCCSIPVTSEVFIADKNNNFPSPRIYCSLPNHRNCSSALFSNFFSQFPFYQPLRLGFVVKESQLMKIWILSIGNNLEWWRKCEMKTCGPGVTKVGLSSLLLIVLCSERVLGRRGLLIFPSRVPFIRPKGEKRREEQKQRKLKARQATDQLRSITLIRWLIKITRASLR